MLAKENNSFNETIHDFVVLFKRLHNPEVKKEFDKKIDILIEQWEKEDET